MIAGLPGIGLGGVFYAVLIVLMPFRAALRGDRRAQHWRVVARLWALLLAIVAAIGFLSLLLRRAVPDSLIAEQAALAGWLVLVPPALMALLLGSLWLVARVMQQKEHVREHVPEATSRLPCQ